MRTYECPSGHVILLDDDVELPGRVSVGSHGYAQIWVGRVEVLHRWLMGCTPGDGNVVDHKDRNPLNCQRGNLRVTTPSGNNQNRTPGPRANAYPMRNKWQAKVKFQGHQHHLGTYATAEEASAVAQAWKAERFTEAV